MQIRFVFHPFPSPCSFVCAVSRVCVPLRVPPRLTLFAEAVVMGVVEDEKQGSALILDRTVFHPQGGGQPSDHGNDKRQIHIIHVALVSYQ